MKNYKLSENAKRLLNQRYSRPGEQYYDVYPRVANFLGAPDGLEDDFLRIIQENRFLPNSPCLRNAAKSNLMSACFVLPIEDSLDGIFTTLRQAAIIFKEGGGVGYSFDNLRQKNAPLSSGGTSSGVMSFLRIFDSITEAIKQGGMRRGASMGVLQPNHPEILDFINEKVTSNRLNNFNLSVLVNNDFMEKLDTEEYVYFKDRLDRRKTMGKIKARDLFSVITHAAWLSGDPGLLFYDRINEDNIYRAKNPIIATNPCFVGDTLVAVADGRKAISIKQLAEEGKNIPIYTMDNNNNICIKWGTNPRLVWKNQRLIKIVLDDGSEIKCTLTHHFPIRNGGIVEAQNLKKGNNFFRFDSKNKRIKKELDYKVLYTEILDEYEDVYDMNVEETGGFFIITSKTNNSMSGILEYGCAEQPLLPYESCCLGSINLNEHVEKNEFNWDKFKESIQIGTKFLIAIKKLSEFPIKECQVMSAKTNRIGLGVVGFADALVKLHIKYDSKETLDFIDKVGKMMYEEAKRIAYMSASVLSIAPTGSLSILMNTSPGIEPIYAPELERHLTIGTIKESREESEYLRLAHEIPPIWHLKVQAQWQKWVESGVSKTINMPSNSSIQDIQDIYVNAWQMGCKGITVYRDKSKPSQVYYNKSGCENEQCYL